MAIDKNGTVYSAGNSKNGQRNVEGWNDIARFVDEWNMVCSEEYIDIVE